MVFDIYQIPITILTEGENNLNSQYITSVELEFSEEDKKYYPYNINAFKDLNRLEFKNNVTFFIGENGSGKSTMLEAIAVSLGLNPEGGSKNFTFSTKDTHSELYKKLRVVKGYKRIINSYFLRAESFYNLATEIDSIDGGSEVLLSSYGGNSLHHQSHGESFMSLILNRLTHSGIYLFDEPEAALSSFNQLVLLKRMKYLSDEGAQFIIATHSPFLLAYPNATIYEFSCSGIESKQYEETDQYSFTKYFINNYEKYLVKLFEA